MKNVVFGFCFLVLAFGAVEVQSETIFYLNFDEAADVTAASGTIYTPGSTEIVNTSPAGLGTATIQFVDSGEPDDENEVAADGASIGTPSGVSGTAQGGKALLVDGDGSDEGLRITVDNAMENQDFTMEAIWFTRDAVASSHNGGIQTIIGDNWPQLDLYPTPDPERSQFQMLARSTSRMDYYADQDAAVVLQGTDINESYTWYHDTLVFDYNDTTPAESKVRAYRNGRLIGEKTYDASTGETVGLFGDTLLHGNSLTIGMINSFEYRINDHRRSLDGGIDAIAVSNEALLPGSFVLPFTRDAVASVHGGIAAVKLSNDNTTWAGDTALDRDSIRIPVTGGDQLTISFWVRSGDVSQINRFERVAIAAFDDTTHQGDTNFFAKAAVPDVWTRWSTTYTVPASVDNLNFGFRAAAGSSIIIDDVSIEVTSTSTELLTNGGFEQWDGSTPADWRFFSVLGALGSIELVFDAPDSAVEDHWADYR